MFKLKKVLGQFSLGKNRKFQRMDMPNGCIIQMTNLVDEGINIKLKIEIFISKNNVDDIFTENLYDVILSQGTLKK